MKLCFDSIEEVKEFVGSLKGKRGSKNDDETPAIGGQTIHTAPAPLQPPAQPFQPQAGGFPGASAFTPPSGVAPEIAALVTRITARIDSAIGSGQPADQVLTWFRGQCGPEAASATMDQIKAHFLPKLSQPALENIAKLMAA